MAVPFKNGADLYNNEVLRMRLHNLGADPTEVGAGLIYFNTSNGLNTSKKARIYTGDAWKTFAFLEDLDVASNADFIALQEKVALLAGDVDTDAIISNMKEVSAFLEGFAEDASLMDLLNSKLSTGGGTITGTLTIKTDIDAKLVLDNTDTNTNYSLIDFRQNGVSVGMLGILKVGSTDLAWGGKTLLHSGNVGEYALKTDGSNAMTAGLNMGENAVIWSRGGKNQQIIPFPDDDSDKLAYYNGSSWKTIAFTDSDITGTAAKAKNLVDQDGNAVAFVSGTTFYMGDTIYPTTSTQILGKDVRLRYGANASYGFWLNPYGNVTIGSEDKAGNVYKLHVAGPAYLRAYDAAYGTLGRRPEGSVVIGTDNYGLISWSRNDGNTLMQVARFDDTATAYNLILQHLGGNVGIGITNPTEKLDVGGTVKATNAAITNYIYALAYRTADESGVWKGSAFSSALSDTDLVIKGDTVRLIGDLHVTGNIIADGEVSAGGAGEEGETESTGNASAWAQTFVPTNTTMPFEHNRATTDVIVQVYEKNDGGSWDMILVDVEIISETKVNLHFGRTETREHKIVIMG